MKWKDPQDIVKEMRDVMPFSISDTVVPYIIEAMEIHAKQEIESVKYNNYVFTPEQIGLLESSLKETLGRFNAIVNSK